MAVAVQTEKKHHFGRPEKPVDWERVIKALEYGATGVQIASWFSMYPDTFYDKVKEKFGLTFTAFAALHTPKGELDLLAKQHEQALKGNTQLLVMLGQERLGQGKNKDANTHITQLNFKVNYDGDNNKVEILPEKLSAECTESARQGCQEGGVVLSQESGQRSNDI
jgi:hypothetical protein